MKEILKEYDYSESDLELYIFFNNVYSNSSEDAIDDLIGKSCYDFTSISVCNYL